MDHRIHLVRIRRRRPAQRREISRLRNSLWHGFRPLSTNRHRSAVVVTAAIAIRRPTTCSTGMAVSMKGDVRWRRRLAARRDAVDGESLYAGLGNRSAHRRSGLQHSVRPCRDGHGKNRLRGVFGLSVPAFNLSAGNSLTTVFLHTLGELSVLVKEMNLLLMLEPERSVK